MAVYCYSRTLKIKCCINSTQTLCTYCIQVKIGIVSQGVAIIMRYYRGTDEVMVIVVGNEHHNKTITNPGQD